nr:MAG TPA: hypothetical protein [Caudoviricetes sp.]
MFSDCFRGLYRNGDARTPVRRGERCHLIRHT